MILYNCGLSALVLQERIQNGYYLKIKQDEKTSKDLVDLRSEIFAKRCPEWFRN